MIWILIPTGQRTKQAGEVVAAWKRVGFDVFVYAWDENTYLECQSADDVRRGPMRSFAVLQNWMAKQVFAKHAEVDGVICGADDLWPISPVEEIQALCDQNPDEVIWVKDGCFNQQPTHPIVTRGWWDKHGENIFSEAYRHNFCDTDLALRCVDDNSIVKCFDVDGFEHQHWLKTGKKSERDEIYRIGERWFQSDQFIFESRFPQVNILAKLQSIERVKLQGAVA